MIMKRSGRGFLALLLMLIVILSGVNAAFALESEDVNMVGRLNADLEHAPDGVSNALYSRVTGYFMAKSNLLGIQLPNVALWAAGFVLVCVIVILILKLVSPSGAKSDANKLYFEVAYDGETCSHAVNRRKRVSIGSAVGNFPLNVADEGVSGKHCEIYLEGGSVMLEDFSSYGTMINGTMCHHSKQLLHSGDVIEIGNHRITIQFQQ